MRGWTRTQQLPGFALLLLLGPLAAPQGFAEQRDPEQTRAIMHQLLDSLQVLLLATADADLVQSPTERAKVQAAADALGGDAKALAEHARQMDRGAVYVGRHLAQDAREIERSIERGQIQRAEYLIQNLTQNCIACHARLPSPKDSMLAEAFVGNDRLTSLPPGERADLQIATRRFDAALDTLEALLTSSRVPPEILIGPMTDYLTVSIRVKRDTQRPVPVLEAFGARPDLWPQLREEVGVWTATLPAIRTQVAHSEDVATGRALLEEARRHTAFPADRSGLVYAIAASSVLNRYVEGKVAPSPELAEAYYLLGLSEIAIAGNYWVSPADFYLATAIQLAPGQPFAREAYTLLEEQTLADYEGSSEESIPDDQMARLRALRQLIEQPPEAPPSNR